MTKLNPEVMQNIFMRNSDAVAVISNSIHIIANEAYARLFRYSHFEDLLVTSVKTLIDRDKWDEFDQFIELKRINNHLTSDLKSVGIRKDGTRFLMELTATQCNAEDQDEMFLIAVRDNTEQMKIEEDLEKSRRSLAMIKQCHQILLREEKEQPFLDKVTQMISAYTGYDLVWYTVKKSDGTMGTASFVNEKKEIGSIRSLYIASKCMNSRETLICNSIYECDLEHEELEHIIAGGYRSIISLPLIVNDMVIGALNIFSRTENTFVGDKENLENLVEDICYGIKAIRLNEKQIDLEKQLLQAQKMETIGTLAGGIAHDFNNIMTPIMGYSEIILAKMSPDDPLYKFNEQILSGAARARELVKQIMAFSHKENHKKEPVFVDKIVRETLQFMSSLIPKTISIHKHLNKHCGKIYADPAQIHQVIANLCTNGFHAMEEKGGDLTIELKRISVDWEMKSRYPELDYRDYAELIIGDSGMGMDQETRSRIFEPFFTTKPVGKGTGLGLSVVHGIVKNHGGHIAVESEVGLGTLFRIFFPILLQEPLVEELIEIEEGHSKVILLLDDHRDITEVLKLMLVNSGYVVETYNDSKKALSRYNENPLKYSLIITDYHMPDINGLEIIREFRRRNKEIPSIVITGHDNLFSSEEMKNLNIKKIIEKPIMRNNFLDAVNSCFEKETQ